MREGDRSRDHSSTKVHDSNLIYQREHVMWRRYSRIKLHSSRVMLVTTFVREYPFRHELVDSEPQWREAQKRKGEGVQRAVVSLNNNVIKRVQVLKGLACNIQESCSHLSSIASSYHFSAFFLYFIYFLFVFIIRN